MTPAEAYRRVLATATAIVERGFADHAYYGHEDLRRVYERVFGAYEVALMSGARLDDSETPARWYERMEKVAA